jgi:hypothetical protein
MVSETPKTIPSDKRTKGRGGKGAEGNPHVDIQMGCQSMKLYPVTEHQLNTLNYAGKELSAFFAVMVLASQHAYELLSGLYSVVCKTRECGTLPYSELLNTARDVDMTDFTLGCICLVIAITSFILWIAKWIQRNGQYADIKKNTKFAEIS